MPEIAPYQDYVIKDGKLVGDFDQMYHDHEDPWEQSTREKYAIEKDLALGWIARNDFRTVLELGCGLGYFTSRIREETDAAALGIDISPEAIRKARERDPLCGFAVDDILGTPLDYSCIVMAELTWYVLDDLAAFRDRLGACRPGTGFVHLLAIYPPGVQQLGTERFTDVEGMVRYFDCVRFEHWGTVFSPATGARTFAFGRV